MADTKIIIKVGVCKGRHEMPCSDYVFDKIEDPTDVALMRDIANKYFMQFWGKMPFKCCYFCDVNSNDVVVQKIAAELEIYVTGLTVAVIEVLQAALHYFSGYNIKLMHYDASTGNYYPQRLNIIAF